MTCQNAKDYVKEYRLIKKQMGQEMGLPRPKGSPFSAKPQPETYQIRAATSWGQSIQMSEATGGWGRAFLIQTHSFCLPFLLKCSQKIIPVSLTSMYFQISTEHG